MTIQQGWIVCQGGIEFTNGQGVWDANNAYEWDELRRHKDIRLVRRFQTKEFFRKTNPRDIDNFGRLMLELTFGPDMMEQWYRSKRSDSCSLIKSILRS
jgi:hypothetical protein